MALMDGKVAVIMGVANKRSIAWGITKALSDAGAKIELGSGVAAAQAWYRTSGASALRVAAE